MLRRPQHPWVSRYRRGVLSRRETWAVALVATLTMTVSYVDRSTLSVLAPSVTKALDISNEAYGWLTSAFALAYLVGAPLGGWWIDRVGARRGLLGSLLVWSAIAGLHALAPGFVILFALRIGLGLAEGPSFPGSSQTVQRVLAPAERERGFGILFTGSSLGGMLAPLVASWLYRLHGWRFAFLGTAAVGLVWLPLWIVVTRRARAVLDAPREQRPARRTTIAQLLRSPIIQRALIGIFSVAPISGFMYAWGAKFLATTHGVSQGSVGNYLWLPPLMFDTGAILFGDLASRQRRAPGVPARGLYACAVVLAACLALIPFAATPWQAMVLLGLAMAGGGGQYTLVASDFLSRVPPDAVALAGGTVACAQSIAHIIMGPLVGWAIVQYSVPALYPVGSVWLPVAHPSYTVALIALAACAIPGAITWLVWRVPPRLE